MQLSEISESVPSSKLIDAIELYDPHPIQERFHKARKTHRRRWFCGGRQSGKTEAGAAEAFWMAVKAAPGGTGAIFAPDYPKAQVAEARFNHFVPHDMREWHGGKRRWLVDAEDGKQSVVHLRHADPDAPRGLVLDWAWLDEAAMFAEEFWNNLRACLAVKRGSLFATTTPKGRNWVWRQAVQDAEDHDLLVHCSSLDNPSFPPDEWDLIKARYGEESPFFRQEYLGLFEAFAGQAITQFNRTKHVRRADLNPRWKYYRCWDFGWRAGTVCLWLMVSPDEDVYVIGERYWKEQLRTAILADLTYRDAGIEVPIASVAADFIDPSGASSREPESGDPGWRRNLEDLGCTVKYNRKVTESAGMNLIREWANRGKLIVFPHCHMMINALETAELAGKDEVDRLKHDQHPQVDFIDALRYGFAGLFAWAAPRVQVVT